MGRRALAAAADRRQPQKQQHKKKKAAGSCCCWILLLWWVGLRCARQCALRGAAAGGSCCCYAKAGTAEGRAHKKTTTAAQQKSCFSGVGLRCARRSPWEEGRRASGLPDFRTSGLRYRASDFRASDFRAFGLLGCFCRHGGFCRRCCCHQPGQPTRAGTEDPAAAAAINPDSRPVPERWILPPLLLEPSNPATNVSRGTTRTADPCRNGGSCRCCCHQPGQPTRAGTEDPAAAAAVINPLYHRGKARA